jgi:Ala-tRNA(Pro) deacylase
MASKIGTEIFKNKPKSMHTPIEKETYDLLHALGISYDRVSHEAAATISQCQLIEKVIDAPIHKNLLLRNSANTQLFFLVMMGYKRFITKEVSKQIGSSRLSFADDTTTEALLGVSKGSLSILSLFKDPECRIQLLIDQDVCQYDFFGCHPCDNRSTLKIKTQDIFNVLLSHTGHSPVQVKI